MKFTESASRSTCLAGGRFVASAAFSPASLPGEEAYRDVRRHPEAITFPGLLIWRAGGDLFFASIGHVDEGLKAALATNRPPARHVLLDADSVNFIDTSA